MTKEKTEEWGKTQDRTADKGNRVYSMKIIKICGPKYKMCTFKKLINFTGLGNRYWKTYKAKPG